MDNGDATSLEADGHLGCRRQGALYRRIDDEQFTVARFYFLFDVRAKVGRMKNLAWKSSTGRRFERDGVGADGKFSGAQPCIATWKKAPMGLSHPGLPR
ncbi:hypothetical protein ABY43_29510 [Rhizobium giardinii]